MGAQKLVSWTSNSCTVLFISAILAISVTIAVETRRNTEGILTAKLTDMARWKIAILFIAVVTAVIPMVTFQEVVNAELFVRTAELV